MNRFVYRLLLVLLLGLGWQLGLGLTAVSPTHAQAILLPQAIADGNMPESLAAAFTFDGAQFALPSNVSYWPVFYNKQVFADNCAACHGEDGGGDHFVGAPALNDAIWLYGGDRDDIVAQVGTPNHGVMPAWQGRLSEDDIKMLTVYVHSLGGGR